MTRRHLAWASCVAVLVLAAPAAAFAQTASPPAPPGRSGMWLLAGGTTTTILGDCTGCEADTYLHTGGVFATIGAALNRRTDAGVEVLWVPATSAAGDPIKTTFLMGSAEFQPWLSQGFFLRVGAGMALVRNWIIITNDDDPPVFTSKAFALALAAGWQWRVKNGVGVQVFGAQHVAALGDLQTRTGVAENVMGNYWSVGAAIVIR